MIKVTFHSRKKFNAVKVYKDLMGLDVNKENLIEQEIKDRLGRVEKVEMAKAIKVTDIIISIHLQY